MSHNTFGHLFRVTTFGESHGPALGCIVDGCPPNIPLQAEDIQTGLHYPTPVHLQPAHADLGYETGDFPEAEAAARSVLSLPMYPELSAHDIETVAHAVREDAHVH